MKFVPCACLGPMGNDPYCPCGMRARGLTPTRMEDDPRYVHFNMLEFLEALREAFNED